MPDPSDPWPWSRRRARLRRSGRRLLLARRRPLAALCAGVAVVGGVHAARPTPPPTVAVTVAARDLPAGSILTRDDLAVRRFPTADAPAGSGPAAVGRTLAAPVREGEAVTDVRLVSPSLVSGFPDRVAMPVRIADADAAGLLRAGDHIDLLAADPRGGRASYVAVNVPVLALPAPADGDGAAGGLTGRLVVVAVLAADVDRIAGAAATDLLSVVLTH
jgi:Flp pilus assembly protein CpaB